MKPQEEESAPREISFSWYKTFWLFMLWHSLGGNTWGGNQYIHVFLYIFCRSEHDPGEEELSCHQPVNQVYPLQHNRSREEGQGGVQSQISQYRGSQGPNKCGELRVIGYILRRKEHGRYHMAGYDLENPPGQGNPVFLWMLTAHSQSDFDFVWFFLPLFSRTSKAFKGTVYLSVLSKQKKKNTLFSWLSIKIIVSSWNFNWDCRPGFKAFISGDALLFFSTND